MFGPNGDGSVYVNFADQRLYWVRSDGNVVSLTPPDAFEEDARYRFADGVLDAGRGRIICVREDHTDPKPANVVNTICAVSLDGSGSMEVLVSGHDFYAAPRLSPDGKKLAYICWNHPNMPWDFTELQVATLGEETGAVAATESVCGADGSTSVLQPSWSPEGALHFVADLTGWWNLYRYDEGRDFVSLCPRSAEFSGPSPGWSLGAQNYCFLTDGRIATCYEDRDAGSSRLVIIPSAHSSAAEGANDLPEEFGQDCLPRSIANLCPSPDGKTLYFLGGDPDKAGGIFAWNIPEEDRPDTAIVAPADMIASSMSSAQSIDPAFVSSPELLRFPTAGGEHAYGYYYPPANPLFEAPHGAKPPLLVKAHGGPTSCARVSLNPAIQFWTSRGFAVLDVDYRGSTGYGREYRDRLKGNWGVVDIEDVCAGAEYMVSEGLADPTQLAIDGGSAGGFTTLGALTFREVFTAGCSLYGVADLAALAGDTHKFESRYLDGLVGRYPEDQELYDARAPIKHAERLACPILLLQGAEDKIVPPNQAETMYAVVKDRGLPCALKVYAEEQHGFRRSENIEDALNSELVFFTRVFGIEAAGDDLPALQITNLDTGV